MLEDLLTIRRRREDDAAAVAGEARRTVAERRAACEARRAALDKYNARQEEEKARLYEEVHHKSVTRAKLEGYRERIGLLRQRQLQLEEEREKADGDLRAAEAELGGGEEPAPRRPPAGGQARGVPGRARDRGEARGGAKGGNGGGRHFHAPLGRQAVDVRRGVSGPGRSFARPRPEFELQQRGVQSHAHRRVPSGCREVERGGDGGREVRPG